LAFGKCRKLVLGANRVIRILISVQACMFWQKVLQTKLY